MYLLPLHSLFLCHSVGWQETCQMCQSHMKCMTLVSPDSVAPRLTVKSKTQTNPKGKDEGPTQTIKDCRTGLSVFVYSVILSWKKIPVITTQLLNSLLYSNSLISVNCMCLLMSMPCNQEPLPSITHKSSLCCITNYLCCLTEWHSRFCCCLM